MALKTTSKTHKSRAIPMPKLSLTVGPDQRSREGPRALARCLSSASPRACLRYAENQLFEGFSRDHLLAASGKSW